MFKPVEVKALPNYRLWLRYDDGVEGEVDVSGLAGKGIFSIWNDADSFAGVYIVEHGAIAWNDDVELCPDALYLEVTGQKAEDVFPI